MFPGSGRRRRRAPRRGPGGRPLDPPERHRPRRGRRANIPEADADQASRPSGERTPARRRSPRSRQRGDGRRRLTTPARASAATRIGTPTKPTTRPLCSQVEYQRSTSRAMKMAVAWSSGRPGQREAYRSRAASRRAGSPRARDDRATSSPRRPLPAAHPGRSSRHPRDANTSHGEREQRRGQVPSSPVQRQESGEAVSPSPSSGREMSMPATGRTVRRNRAAQAAIRQPGVETDLTGLEARPPGRTLRSRAAHRSGTR